MGGSGWALEVEASELRGLFEEHEPVAGKLSAVNARTPLVQSGLPTDTLRLVVGISVEVFPCQMRLTGGCLPNAFWLTFFFTHNERQKNIIVFHRLCEVITSPPT